MGEPCRVETAFDPQAALCKACPDLGESAVLGAWLAQLHVPAFQSPRSIGCEFPTRYREPHSTRIDHASMEWTQQSLPDEPPLCTVSDIREFRTASIRRLSPRPWL